MAYSRWGEKSPWYTYWCSSDAVFMKDQIFDVCSVHTFSYSDLKKDIKGCLSKVEKKVNKDWKEPCTKEQLEELKGYMVTFMRDVETDPEILEVEQIRACKERDLPLLVSQIKTGNGKEYLAKRLRSC